MTLVRKLTEKDVPSGSLCAVWNDVHIGIDDRPAIEVAIECAEREGVTHNFANGDIYDCGPAAPHLNKRKRATLDRGALLEEAAGGRWFTNWLMTRWCEMGTGNHEDWINDLALDPALAGSVSVSSALGLPGSLRVLPCGYQWRIGSLVIEHGDALFGKGSKSASPAAKALAVAPDHSTICGHLHHMDTSWRSAPDENGIMRSRVAHVSGHLSLPDAHSDYAPRNPNWQQGFTLVRVYWDAGKARFSIYPIEILRDRRNRPYFEFNNKVYR